MSSRRRTGPGRPLIRLLSRIAFAVADFFADWHYAQRRAMQIRLDPNLYLQDPATPPENYGEFLYRTKFSRAPREPAADRRRPGRASHGPRHAGNGLGPASHGPASRGPRRIRPRDSGPRDAGHDDAGRGPGRSVEGYEGGERTD